MNKRNFMFLALLGAMVFNGHGEVRAQDASRWHNVDVNQQNRAPRRAAFFAFENQDKAQAFEKKNSANYLSMEGTWKFNFVKDYNKRPVNFFAANFDDSQWKDFPVPGLFELNGYGDATYKNTGYAWATQFDPNPPYISELNNYTGSYRRTFDLPKDWKGKDVYFHVGSATSNLTLWVNGKYVGYSEDSKVAAEFNISKYLKPGKNLIAMQVMRWCDGSYFEDQDFWRFTGIAREVYLYARPKVHAADIRLDAGLENQYRDGVLNYLDAVNGAFNIYNENFFKNIDDLHLTATIYANGVKLSTVEIPETKGIAPQTTKMVKSDALKYAIAEAESEHGKEEITVNFAFASDGTEPLVEKGQVMTRQQFVINEYQFDKVDTPIAATSTKISGKKGKLQNNSSIEVEENNSYVKVSAKRMSVTIGKKTGMIDYLDVDGEPILKFRESMKPEFWRAPTDNDYGASLQKELKVWKNPVMNLKSFDKSEMKDSIVLTATFEMPEVKAELILRYCINAEGEVSVTEKMTTDKAAKVADLFRYGMVLDLPASFSKLEYYGRGPEENYIDRHSSTFIGKYESDVKDEYYPYVRPQESGNHTDIRYFSIFNPALGKGITFEGYAPMECSAIPYSIEDLDSGDEKEHAWGQHSGDLVDKGLTQVHIQQRQYGLGCIDSWMTKPMEKYRMHYGDREFRFVIKAK